MHVAVPVYSENSLAAKARTMYGIKVFKLQSRNIRLWELEWLSPQELHDHGAMLVMNLMSIVFKTSVFNLEDVHAVNTSKR